MYKTACVHAAHLVCLGGCHDDLGTFGLWHDADNIDRYYSAYLPGVERVGERLYTPWLLGAARAVIQ